MKIGLLTTRLFDPSIPELCAALARRGCPVSEIVCARNPRESPLAHLAANSGLARRLLLRRGSGRRPGSTETLRVRLFLASFSADPVLRHVEAARPDILVHRQGPIFRRGILSIPRLGLVNCHMGLLPEFRGMNAAEWSILHGFPAGNSVHFIDTGIDTGDILRFFPVDVRALGSVAAVRSRLADLHFDHLAEAIAGIGSGSLTRHPQRPEDGRQYFRMHADLLRLVEAKLREGYSPARAIDQRPYVAPSRDPA